MKKYLTFCLPLLLVFACSDGQDKHAQGPYQVLEAIPLYEGAAPGSENWRADNEIVVPVGNDRVYFNVANPSLTPYIPDPAIATGAAMIVCPGGGYKMLSMQFEGFNYAEWLASHGIAAFILKYRIEYQGDTAEEVGKLFEGWGDRDQGMPNPDTMSEKELEERFKRYEEEKTDGPSIRELAGDDGRAAMAYVRAHATEYGIDPDRIGMIGSSAGSGIVLNVAYNHDERSKPNFIVPVYGSTMETTLPADPTPLFAVAPEFDVFGGPTAYNLYEMWHKAKLPAELHYFAETSHGFGIQNNGEPVNVWIQLLYNFMIKEGFISGEYILNL